MMTISRSWQAALARRSGGDKTLAQDYETELQTIWQQKQPEDFRYRDRFNVLVKDILPPRFQMRSENDKDFSNLVRSVKEQGIIEPLIVSRVGEKFRLIAGSRRLAAGKAVGLELVPVVVKDVDDVEAELIALSENLQRKDLSAAEKCEALIHLYQSAGYDPDTTARYLSALTNRHYQADKYKARRPYSDRIPVPDDLKRLAEKTGLTFATQYQLLRLRVLPPEILEYASKKKLPAYKVIELATPEFLAKSDEEKKGVIYKIEPAHKGRRPETAKKEYGLAELAADEKKVKNLSGGFAIIDMENVYLPAADLEYYRKRAKAENIDLGSCMSRALMFKSPRTKGASRAKIEVWYSYKNRGCVKVA